MFGKAREGSRRLAISQQTGASVVLEELPVADIGRNRFHRPMSARRHHLERRGTAPCGARQKPRPQRMVREHRRVQADTLCMRFDYVGHRSV